jgi:hypothetical protein
MKLWLTSRGGSWKRWRVHTSGTPREEGEEKELRQLQAFEGI